ncbi:50S ribosomal protein L28, partial [Citrobacter sp. TBCS-11]
MSKECYFTGRKTVSSNNRSHAMNQTKRVVKPNLQKVTILEKNNGWVTNDNTPTLSG